MTDGEVINPVTINVYAHVIYGIKGISDVEVILTNNDTGESFTGISDSNGDCTIQIIGSSNEEESGDINLLLRDYLVEVGCEHYSTNINVFTATSDDNQLVLYLVKLDDCQNQILTRKDCKYFHHEPYMTPNNYDLYFDPAKIPVNVIQEAPHELLLRLQKTMPLTDILHLNFEREQSSYLNVVNLHSSLKLKFNTRDLQITNAPLKIIGSWKSYEESEQLCNKTYEFDYLYDVNIPVEDVIVKLINKEYPLIQYVKKTDVEGKCTFNNLPYGIYIQQFITSEYKLPQSLITVNNEEEYDNILLGSNETDSTLDFYLNGILSTVHLMDIGGTIKCDSDVEYDKGKLTINSANEASEEDLISVFLHSDENEEDNINFTEFTVKIIDINKGVEGIKYLEGVLESSLFEYSVGTLTYNEYVDYYNGHILILTDGEIVAEVKLNESNNFIAETESLPIFEEGKNNRIFYQVRYDKEYCDVIIEDIDNIGLMKNEVVLF